MDAFWFQIYNLPALLFLERYLKRFPPPLPGGTTIKLSTRLIEKYGISRREHEVLDMVLQGKANKEIEDALSISIRTVETHLHRIYKKLGINSRLQLVGLVREFRE